MRKPKRKPNRARMQGVTLAIYVVGVCLAAGPRAAAQAAGPQEEERTNFRLLTAKEGRTIVDQALDQDQTRDAQDCSHLVHEIYQHAGYEYPYASSFDIYAGGEDFVRVRKPQAGDLVVWPGHVGIVVDPAQHSFYSLVSSGAEAQDYEGTYWRARGKARFFRFRVEQAASVASARSGAAPRSDRSSKQTLTPSVVEKGSAAEVAGNRPPKPARERTAVIYGPPPPTPGPTPGEDSPEVSGAPLSILVSEGKKPPTREEVAEGISEVSNAAGNVLRTGDLSKLVPPVVVFERLNVERVEIKRNHGWAYVDVESRGVLGGHTQLRRRSEKVRWELRRTDSGWEAVMPLDRTYVLRDAAVRKLAAQLARLTESNGAAAHDAAVLRQESQLASLLSGLLDGK